MKQQLLKQLIYYSTEIYAPRLPKMTGREMEVVKLCCDGLTSKEIAGKLNVSVRTVDAHKGNIFKKLKISSTVELIRYAVKAGLYTADSQ